MKDRYFHKKKIGTPITAAMADMALLLLIFFLSTTAILQNKKPDKPLELPKAVTTEMDGNYLYVYVTKEEEIFFDEKKVSQEELLNLLLNRRIESNTQVVLAADGSINYAVIEDLLNIFREKDLENVVFLAKPNNIDDE